MEHHALKVAYNGTAYCGWQCQKNGLSVQECIQDAVESAFGMRLPVTGCSRTDAGVHASGFVCTVDGLPGSIPVSRIPEVINAKLPSDISVLSASPVGDDFHPRYSAKGKEYCYTIRNERIASPFDCPFVVLYPTKISINAEKLNILCQQFCGTHDFTSFMATGSKITDPKRTIQYFHCKRDMELIRFTVAADGFLYNMVRILVGTLLDIDSGLITESPTEILNALDRSHAGHTMPAKGLCLTNVFYDSELF